MRRWLIDYNAALRDAKDADFLEDDDAWSLTRPELSFALWKLGKRFDWQIPLWPGGLVDWPDWFIHDMSVLSWVNRMIRRDMGLKD